MLVVDDSTLDKPYAQKMDLVQRHWSGKHHAVVEGINLSTLLWTDRDCHVPVDYRVYDKVGDALLISPSRSLPYNRPAMRCDTVVSAGRLVGVHVVGRSVRRASGGFASALRAAPRNRNPARRLKWAESSSIHEVLHGKY